MRKSNQFFNRRTEKIAVVTACILVVLLLLAIVIVNRTVPEPEPGTESASESTTSSDLLYAPVEPEPVVDEITSQEVSFDPGWQYAENSAIHSDAAILWTARPGISNGKTVCVNAGHGTSGGSDVKTLCHPDGTPKVTGGTTEEGATTAVAVSSGTELLDGTAEAEANLQAAVILKEKLLESGYNVLMIREGDDVQLDNIARTLLANHYADAHIALHYDSTGNDKGVFFMSVPSSAEYRSMEPVAQHYEEHNALGRAVVGGIREAGVPIFEGGELEMDLTQTSYSEIPSIDLEIGDTATVRTDARLEQITQGILNGLNTYFGI